jgi:hypothetical protein
MRAESQFPGWFSQDRPLLDMMLTAPIVRAPEKIRIAVKLNGSIKAAPRAIRHKIEFAAKATSARLGSQNVFRKLTGSLAEQVDKEAGMAILTPP